MVLDARKPDFVTLEQKGVDQPAHSRSRISSIVIQYFETIEFKLLHVKCQNASQSLWLSLRLTWSESPKTGFLASWPK